MHGNWPALTMSSLCYLTWHITSPQFLRFHPITELTRNIASNCEEKSSFAETQSHHHDIIIDLLTATLATNPWACGPTEKECGGKKIFGNKQGADKKLRRAVMKTPVTNGAAPLLQTIRTAHNIAPMDRHSLLSRLFTIMQGPPNNWTWVDGPWEIWSLHSCHEGMGQFSLNSDYLVTL